MKRPADSEPTGKLILDGPGVTKTLETLGRAILKDFGHDTASLALIGIQTRGAHLARRLVAWMNKETGQDIPLGILDITLYRDDVHTIAEQPDVKETDLPFDIEGRSLILIDDVLYTGRTVRSAMNALIDYGRQRCIRLAVLIDRGHHELPIGADYVGQVVDAKPEDVVDVNVSEVDEEDSVYVRSRS